MMKNLLATLLVCVSLVGTPMDADAARRFGGGANLGRPAPVFNQKAPAASPKAPATQPGASQSQPRQTTAPVQQAQRPSMMRSMLTGLAAALGISALLSWLGIGGAGIVSLIMGALLAVALFMVLRLVLSRRAPRPLPAGASSNETHRSSSSTAEPMLRRDVESPVQVAASGSVMDQFMKTQAHGEQEQPYAQDVTPEDFDKESFLRVARDNYVALQRAWDSGNVLEIADFTTPDVFTAITHQLRERGAVTQKTTVVALENELLGIAREGNEYLASIRFHGTVDVSGELEDLDETWVLVKPIEGAEGWLLAAIKQNDASA